MYLEISFAGFFHMLMEFLWPALHVVLRMFERFFSAIAGFFSNLDDVGEVSYFYGIAKDDTILLFFRAHIVIWPNCGVIISI